MAVDRQAQELAGCATIDGDLLIYGPALTSLAPLASLEAVRGDLVIGPTASLRTLSGLEDLRRIDGNLRIEETMRLASAALPALAVVGGSVRVEDNRDLALVRIPGLERVDGDLVVQDNPTIVGVELGPAARIVGERFVQTETELEAEAEAEAETETEAETDG